jgi:hypothetical protein
LPVLAVGIALEMSAASAGCSDGDPDALNSSPTPGAPAPPPGDEGGIVDNGTGPYGDEQALAWLTNECAACHGIDAAGKPAVNASQWSLPQKPTRGWLESTTDSADVYEVLRLAAARKSDGFPVAMPPSALVDDAKRTQVERMLGWMRVALPLTVLNASEVYGFTPEGDPPRAEFTCTKNATLRRFLANFTLAAFERGPTDQELAAFPAAALDAPVTPEARAATVALLAADDHKAEFVDHGLRRLSTAIGGAPNIAPGGPLTTDIATELAGEFHALVSDQWDKAPYRSLFHNDTVMVSANTAPLYGCEAPKTGRVPCTMIEPRHGFFSTLGFLNSKQSSFLATNNNYGRVGFLYFTLFGGVPRAATSGPTGAAASALPGCLEATDTRSLVGASFGTHAIPEVGAFCPGCHLYKGLAAGSVLFRPFSTRGFVYNAADIAAGTAAPGDEDFLLKNALLADRRAEAGTVKVDTAFLSSLTTSALEAPLSCLPTGDPNKPYATFKHLGELTDYLLARSVSVATGFTRHAHRAFANSADPSAEMILRVYSALIKEGTMLDLASAYFGSDSFACDGVQ